MNRTCNPPSQMRLIRAIESSLIDKGFSGAEYRGRIVPMIEQDKKSWSKGRADAMRGAASKCPPGLDKLAYSIGYIEGKAQRAKRPLRVITSPKTTTRPK